MPAIAEMKDGTFLIVGGVKDDGAMVQDPREGAVKNLTLAEFVGGWSGRMILIARRVTLMGRGSKFDISWFVPAVLKYRKLFTEALVASFFLQLAALVTAVFSGHYRQGFSS